MPIVFSDHAKTQLKRRRISLKLALKIVKDPDKIVLSFKKRKLRNKITVITGYYIKEEYEN